MRPSKEGYLCHSFLPVFARKRVPLKQIRLRNTEIGIHCECGAVERVAKRSAECEDLRSTPSHGKKISR